MVALFYSFYSSVSMSERKITPLMQQYFAIKAEYPDTLLFFQVGDFYELFFQDAVEAASHLAIALTKRGQLDGKDIPLCGVPVHALNHYIIKLVKAGYRVALCDQVTKPQPGTVVQRAVTKVYTPATLVDGILLEEKRASYLCTFFPLPEEGVWGLSFTELLTSTIMMTTLKAEEYRALEAELQRFFPDEIVLPSGQSDGLITHLKKSGYVVSPYYLNAHKEPISAHYLLENTLSTEWKKQYLHPTKEAQDALQQRAGAGNIELLYRYLHKHNPQALAHDMQAAWYRPTHYVYLDAATQHNLALVRTTDGSSKDTLLSAIDHTQTAMGGRMLRKWLVRPLRSLPDIMKRQCVVTWLLSSVSILHRVRDLLKQLPDIERIVGRISLQRATSQDIIQLFYALQTIEHFHIFFHSESDTTSFSWLIKRIDRFDELQEYLESSIAREEEASHHVIKQGFDAELDRLRGLVQGGKKALLSLGIKEAERLTIPSLKVLYTSVHGYFFEVTKTHSNKVPEEYQHVQTLANRSRFVTSELKALEHDITHARTRSQEREKELFDQVMSFVSQFVARLRQASYALATLDALYSFAWHAYVYNYVQPAFTEHEMLSIKKGRHPVIERSIQQSFCANDTSLKDPAGLWIITGPNMGGKSTYLRQVALICLLAQCGSYVPAQSATLPLLDRIFTRIGAGDNLAQGKSTFLIEMEEAATICHEATPASLVILDELGRGTSSQDGQALAHALLEYLRDTVKAYTLFATHYHELTHLADNDDRVANYHMKCIKREDTLLFLHELVAGPSHASFGIDVARLAHIPSSIIKRARQLIVEDAGISSEQKMVVPLQGISECQNKVHTSIIEQIATLDLDTITPRQAFSLLEELQQAAQKESS